MLENLEASWQPITSVLALAVAILASAHVLLHKRDVRSSAGWVGLIWLVPVLGGVLYLLLGINRVRRSAAARRGRKERSHTELERAVANPDWALEKLAQPTSHLADLAELVGRVTQTELQEGNRITPLVNGDAAYPAMLEAIEGAQRSIALATYIFDTSRVGRRFIDALESARRRGVEVRVLIDDMGARYSFPTAIRLLRRRGVRTARFMPVFPVWRAAYLNLRSHRKILVVDGKIGFTGGMNIRAGHVLSDRPRSPVRDLHFRLEGAVVVQLQAAFAEDWQFATREALEGEAWFPVIEPVGHSRARAIVDGPDEKLDKVTWTLQGAIACARRSILIVTPYFLPDSTLTTALSTAALRGVAVHVIVPSESNLLLVQCAMWRQFQEVLGEGVRMWLTPPPFEHTKLMLVDDQWVLFGSANWDARSLRLNFELDVECYDAELARSLRGQVEERMAVATELTLAMLAARPLWRKLRDGAARLLMPYL